MSKFLDEITKFFTKTQKTQNFQKNENELYHFGIKGIKWRVSRYQNKDGSLTPKSKKR